MRAKNWVTTTAAAVLVAAVAVPYILRAFTAADTSRWGTNYFPNVPLTTQDGTTVHFYDDLLKGKSVAINVIYTSCADECPLEMARMVQLQRTLGDRMGRDIFFYSISIDPLRDTPRELKTYAEKFGVGPGWLLLTGKAEDIKLITRKLGLSKANDAVSKDGHAESLMVGNEPTGQWMRNSAVDNPRFLAATIGTFLGWKNVERKTGYAEARPLVLDGGEYIFQARCATCHTIGGGDAIGPDLSGVTTRRERAWLARYVQVPDAVLAEGDPIATALFQQYNKVRMPNLRLGSADVAALVDFLEAQDAAPETRPDAHHHHRADEKDHGGKN